MLAFHCSSEIDETIIGKYTLRIQSLYRHCFMLFDIQVPELLLFRARVNQNLAALLYRALSEGSVYSLDAKLIERSIFCLSIGKHPANHDRG